MASDRMQRNTIRIRTVLLILESESDPYFMPAHLLLPQFDSPVRFAVGEPDGITSNAWRVWTKDGDIYITCRDNFKETKVSLHQSGRWRMGLTSQAAEARPELLGEDGQRAWEVWDKPAEFVPGVICAFRLLFPTTELVLPELDRTPKKWKDVIFIEAAPPGSMTVVALYITKFGEPMTIANIASKCLGVWHLPDGTCAQLLAQGEPIGQYAQLLEQSVATARDLASQSIDMPAEPYYQFFGKDTETGARFILVGRDRA